MSNKEEVLFQKRVQDLSNRAYSKDFPIYTDFLSMNELSILHTMSEKLAGVRYETYGGYEFAERQMAMFVSDAFFCGEDKLKDYPITLIKIEPVHKKFAEALTHRDYLGSILGLGIERSMLGDIVVLENCAYVYCCSKMADFFLKEITKVRNTFVKVSISTEQISIEANFQEIKGTVASLRADVVIAMVYKQSRNSALDLFRSQKVFINGRLTESNSQSLKENDIVSVRGFGRFIFTEIVSVTKKNRFYILVKKY